MRILSVLALLVTAGASLAQCRTVSPSYYQPAYQYQYQQTYANYQIVQPVAIPTFIIPNQFYSIEPDIAAARIQQQIADDAAERALAKMLNLLRQQQQAAPAVPGSPGAPGAAIPPAAGPGAFAPHDHPSSLSTKVQTMATQQCVSCHHGPGSKDGGKLDLRDVTKLNEFQAAKMVGRTTLNKGDPGFMPQNGEFIGEQPYADLAHWSYEVSKHSAGAGPAVPQSKKELDPKAKVPDSKIPPTPPDKAKDGKDDDSELLAARKRRR